MLRIIWEVYTLAIITVNQIYQILKQRYSFWLFFVREQFLIDSFHLQLHTSIRVWIKDIQYSDLPFSNNVIQQQLIDVKNFLKKSIEKYD